jgi:hypothetical protein
VQCLNCAFQALVVLSASTINTAHRVRCARSYATGFGGGSTAVLQRSERQPHAGAAGGGGCSCGCEGWRAFETGNWFRIEIECPSRKYHDFSLHAVLVSKMVLVFVDLVRLEPFLASALALQAALPPGPPTV